MMILKRTDGLLGRGVVVFLGADGVWTHHVRRSVANRRTDGRLDATVFWYARV
jgi:hypothetical protein